MDLSNKPLLPRMLLAEPLEGRWLLSAAATPPTSVQITWEPDEEDDGDLEVDIADFPASVRAAFEAAYSGANILEAEIESEEGETHYGVLFEHNGQKIDLTLDENGEIVETERYISKDELPQSVLDQIQVEQPGAELNEEEIAKTDDNTYEFQITNALGEDLEGTATLPVTSEPPAEEPTEAPTAPTPELPVTFADAAAPASSASADQVVETEPAESVEAVQEVAQVEASAEDLERKAREDAIERAAVAKAAAETALPGDDRVARALDALADGAAATIWLPQAAGALIHVLPINVDAIERNIQDVLRAFATIESPVKANVESPLTTGASRVAMAATLVAVVKMLLNQSKKPTTAIGTLEFGPGQSSWGWVLGASTSSRRRRVASRTRKP